MISILRLNCGFFNSNPCRVEPFRMQLAERLVAFLMGGGGHMVGTIGYSILQGAMHHAEIWDTFWDTFGIRAQERENPSPCFTR